MSKILVVDDSKTMQESIQFFLEENDYEVKTANNGQEGLDASNADKYDLIITDINMPVMDGITFIQEVRKTVNGKFVPILVLTTESQGSMINKGKEAGATGWIVKPFQKDKLIKAVKKVL